MPDELNAPELDPIETEVTAEAVAATEAPVTPAADAEPKSMEDTIREKYRELGSPKAVTDVDQPRDETGKFAPKPAAAAKPAEAAKPVEAPVEPAAAEVKPPEAPVEPAVPGTEKAPTSWKGTAQAKWEKLDPEIKAEVHRREQDFHRGLETSKREASLFKELDTVIQPYAAVMRAANMTPQQAIGEMFNTDYLLRSGSPEVKARTIAQLVQYYGIDLSSIPAAAEMLAQGQPIVDPKVAELEQRLQTVTSTIEQEKQEAARREYANVVAETTAFGAKNAHYEAVKLDMAALIESGRASDLQDAYNKAIWVNPEVRAKLIAEQQAADRKLAADKAAAAKKAASTNVATRGTLPAAPAVAGTMEDTIRAAYRKLNGV